MITRNLIVKFLPVTVTDPMLPINLSILPIARQATEEETQFRCSPNKIAVKQEMGERLAKIGLQSVSDT